MALGSLTSSRQAEALKRRRGPAAKQRSGELSSGSDGDIDVSHVGQSFGDKSRGSKQATTLVLRGIVLIPEIPNYNHVSMLTHTKAKREDMLAGNQQTQQTNI